MLRDAVFRLPYKSRQNFAGFHKKQIQFYSNWNLYKAGCKIYEKVKKVIDFLTAEGYLIIDLKCNHCKMKMCLLTKER